MYNLSEQLLLYFSGGGSERVIENWLTRVNERSLEVPFSQLLAGEGHQIIHLSRHGPAEEGKDLITIANDNVPCAFQLKSGKITQAAWEQIHPQIVRLVEYPIIHPSIDSNSPRRTYLVTSGELDEEVRLAIQHLNNDWRNRGHPVLETIVKGQLLKRFKDINTNFWPVQLSFEKTLLEFFLLDGDDYLDKAKFADFIFSLLPFNVSSVNKAAHSRALASTATLASYALSSYDRASNHVAQIEGWTIYTAHLIALVEKHNLDDDYWKESFSIALYAIEQSFMRLCEELKKRTHLVEGNALVDAPFYRGRVTWLVGLVSIFALWNNAALNSELGAWAKEFILANKTDMLLWGEGSVPQFLALYWILKRITSTLEPDQILVSIIDSICTANEDNSGGLADPYHSLAEVIADAYGIGNKLIQENYEGQSYTLEGLVQLYARRNWRQQMRFLWPRISRIDFVETLHEAAWQFCLWRNDENGRHRTAQPQSRQSWAELRTHAQQVDTTLFPELLRGHPAFFCCSRLCIHTG